MEPVDMLKQLVRIGRDFPVRSLIAIGLLFCLPAQGLLAAQSCNCPCAKDAKDKDKKEAATGQLTILAPRPDGILSRAFRSKIQVMVDGAAVGFVDSDTPLTVNAPNGPHTISVSDGSSYFAQISKAAETPITISAQKPLYLQIVNNGLGTSVSEMDAAMAQAMLHPESAGNSPGTIYLYWPKMGLDFGLLANFKTDSPVLLDGRRIGALANGEYLTISAAAGEHTLVVDASSTSGETMRLKFTLGAGATRYFHVQKGVDLHIEADSSREAGEFDKRELKQREASAH